VDQSPSMYFGSRVCFKSVAAAHAAALVAWAHLEQGDRVGGIVFSDTDHREVRPRRSKHSVLHLVHELHGFNAALGGGRTSSSTSYLADALGNVRRVAKHGSAVYVVSDFRALPAQARIHLRQLARHHDVVAIQVSDPLERALPPPAMYTISDGSSRARIDAVSRENRLRFESAWRAFQDDVHDELARARIVHVQLRTDDDLVATLSARFATRDR